VKLLIIARPFVFHGGVERATAGLVGAFVDHGYDVHLLSPLGQAPMPGVTLHTLSLPPLPSAARVLALAVSARRAVRHRSWDVVQSHERTLRQDVYRAGEGCHRAYLTSEARPRTRGLYHRIVLALERRVFARTPRIVAIAESGRREIEALYGVAPSRMAVVYNGVDLDRFHPRNRGRYREAVRGEVGIPASTFTVLFVGSGFARKGLATAIEAFAAGAMPVNTSLWLRAWGSASESSGSAPGPTPSAGTPAPTSWRCRAATSPSATSIWRRSRQGCRWWRAPAPAAPR
jgi:UDP-glucose:(heptosyl)LPS alpha-1,3-glucosyltransferase